MGVTVGSSNLAAANTIVQAQKGDRTAMGRLLMLHDARLRRHIGRRLTADVRAALSEDDVLQETYIEAYRHIRDFRPQGEDAFYRWLATIADRKLIDAVRRLRAAKRPPAEKAVGVPADRSASFDRLAHLLDAKGKTPSGIAARAESIRAMRVAMAALPEPCRQVVWMRHIEGRSVQEVAAAVGRNEHAVHQLAYRGLQMLRERMGSRSRFLSRSD